MTVAAAVLSLATGALVAVYPNSRGVLLLVPAVLFVRMALNAIDGMLAREHAMKSRRGAVLNELGDVIADAGLYLPLALVPGVPAALLTVVVVLGVISEMAGVVAVQIGAERRYDGPLGKSDRAFAFGLIAFLLGCGVAPGQWLVIFAQRHDRDGVHHDHSPSAARASDIRQNPRPSTLNNHCRVLRHESGR